MQFFQCFRLSISVQFILACFSVQVAQAKPRDINGVYTGAPIFQRVKVSKANQRDLCPSAPALPEVLVFSVTRTGTAVTGILGLSALYSGNTTSKGFKLSSKTSTAVFSNITELNGKVVFTIRKRIKKSLTCSYIYNANLTRTKKGGKVDSDNLPHAISNCQELDDIDNGLLPLTTNYYLANDIDCSMTRQWNEGKGFRPISCSGPLRGCTFLGSLDGRGHSINGLFINRPDEEDVGLFEHLFISKTNCIAEAGCSQISNLTLKDVDITGGARVGALLSLNSGGTVENVKVSGKISGNSVVGGIIGHNTLDGKLFNSHAEVQIRGNAKVGGLLGFQERGQIQGSSSSGLITATGGPTANQGSIGGIVGTNGQKDYYDNGPAEAFIKATFSSAEVTGNTNSLGGLVGDNLGQIESCYATGKISALPTEKSSVISGAGGLVGTNSGTILKSSASGVVMADSRAGGLCGSQYLDGEIHESFAVGAVTSSRIAGGLVGSNRGIIANCYAIGDVSAKSGGVGGLVGGESEDSTAQGKISQIINSYATGNVQGGTMAATGKVAFENDVGSLAGISRIVSNSFSSGSASMGQLVGGLAGVGKSGEVSNYFWNTMPSSTLSCYTFLKPTQSFLGLGVSEFVLSNDGCTAVQDQKSYFYNALNEPLRRWNFESIWQAHADGYPTLRAASHP